VSQRANIHGEPNITLPHLILVTASSNCCQRGENNGRALVFGFCL
jgi:hypothetical protein